MARSSTRPTRHHIQGVLEVLDDAREALNDIRSPFVVLTPRSLRRRVYEVMHACATARYAMDAITKSQLRATANREQVDAFEQWKKTRRNAMDRDRLVVWFDGARDDLVHRAISPLTWSVAVHEVRGSDYERPRHIRGDKWEMTVTGLWWVDDQGTPEERREQMQPKVGATSVMMQTAFFDLPAGWPEGKQFDVAEICEKVLQFYRRDLREYWDTWWRLRSETAAID